MSNMREDTEDEISLLDLAITIKQNIRILVLAPVAVGLVVFGSSFLIAPTFTASTSFLPQQQAAAAAAIYQRVGGGSLAAQYVALMNSRSVQDALVNRFDLQKRYEAKQYEDAIRTLVSAARVTAGKDGLIRVEFDDREPAFAAQLANAHVEELRKLLERLALTDSQQRQRFYEKQLEQTKVKLAAAQSAWQLGGASVGALPAESKLSAEAYAGLKAAVTAAHVKLQAMRPFLPEESPEFKLAQSDLGSLQAQLAKADLTNSVAAYDDRIIRYRDFKYQQALTEMLGMQYELAKLDEALDGALIQVVDAAKAPERPSRPKRALIVVSATLATAFALLLFVFIREAWRNSLKDEATAQKLKQLF